MSAESRQQMTVRLRSDDKEFFAANTEACGIEASVAARQILELVIQRMRAGGDFLDALHELKTTWRVPHLTQQLSDASRALSHFKPEDEQAALLDRIERMEGELREIRAKPTTHQRFPSSTNR